MKYLRGALYKPPPLVSVIIPTYNRPESLKEAIESVLRQEYDCFEIIVINDGGIDVQGLINGLNTENKIRYISHKENRGLAAARNTGIRIANGKYIAYLDDDDIFYSSHLDVLVNSLESNEFRVAFTDAFRAYQTRENDKHIVTKRDIPYGMDVDEDQILVGNMMPVLCIMHDKSCLDDIGLFDETLNSHEDWDLWIRMSRKFKFAHIKKLTCEFRWRDDGTTMTDEKREEFLKTMGTIYQKYSLYRKDRPHIHLEQKKNILSLWEEIYLYGLLFEKKENFNKNENMSEEFGQNCNGLQETLIKGRNMDSISMITNVLSNCPSCTPAYNNARIKYVEGGNKWAALTEIIRTLSINPHDVEARKNYMRICSKLKLFEHGLKACYDILDKKPDDFGTVMIQGNILFHMGRKKEALCSFVKGIARWLGII